MVPVFNKADYIRQMKENVFEVPAIFARDVKCCFQRIRRGFCEKDVWSIDYWFLSLIPDMLQQLKDTRYASPGVPGENAMLGDVHGFEVDPTEWNQILDRMIFLFHEADENTCQKMNPLEEEYSEMFDEFAEKYGLFGEKLETEEDREKSGRVMHTPAELPEYRELDEEYFEEEKKLSVYRCDCKDRALEMFSKYFYDLWD